ATRETRRGPRGRLVGTHRRTESLGTAVSLSALDVRPARKTGQLPPPRSAAVATGRTGRCDHRMETWMNEVATPVENKPRTAANYKSAYKPVWCPGCGDYSVLGSVTKALAMVGAPPEMVAVVSGIGCSSRIPAYTSCYGFHGVHGRALAAATGLKVARPELT